MSDLTFLIPSSGLLTAKQASALCGVDVDTIYVWVHRGILPVAARHMRWRYYNLIDVARAEAMTRKVARRPAPTLDGWAVEGAPDTDVASLFAQFAEHAERSPVVPEPVVYYVQFADRVKIGATRNLINRLDSIPHDVVLATEPGYIAVERERHRQFAEFRICGEWFRMEPPLMGHIATLNRPLVARVAAG